MCWLYNEIFHTVSYGSVKCLLYIVNFFTISCLYMVDDDLCGKCSSYRPVRISCFDCLLNSTDILCTAVVKRSSETYDQNFILSDTIFVERIIFGSISGISSEVIRICIFSLDQLFLSVCQFVPCCFCCCTLLIGVLISGLHIDGIDECCNFVCCGLIIDLFTLCLSSCFCLWLCCLCLVLTSAACKKSCCHCKRKNKCKCFFLHFFLLFVIYFCFIEICTQRKIYYPILTETDNKKLRSDVLNGVKSQ